MLGFSPFLNQVNEIVGTAATLKLVAEFGGIQIYFPHRPSPEHKLAQALGFEAMRKLTDVFGGECICIPTGEAMYSKKAAILLDDRTSSVVARSTGSTQRYVRMVREDTGFHDNNQIDLFK